MEQTGEMMLVRLAWRGRIFLSPGRTPPTAAKRGVIPLLPGHVLGRFFQDGFHDTASSANFQDPNPRSIRQLHIPSKHVVRSCQCSW